MGPQYRKPAQHWHALPCSPPCAPVFGPVQCNCVGFTLRNATQASKRSGGQLPPAYDLLAFVLLNQVPEAALLIFQPLSLPEHTLQLLPQVADEVLENGLQVSPGSWEDILLQQLPLGGQHLVLLLQQPDLGKQEM